MKHALIVVDTPAPTTLASIQTLRITDTIEAYDPYKVLGHYIASYSTAICVELMTSVQDATALHITLGKTTRGSYIPRRIQNDT